MDRLWKGVQGPLTVVTGPPGSGKTITVAAWTSTERHEGPVVWLPDDRRLRTLGEFRVRLAECLADVGIDVSVPGLEEPGDGRDEHDLLVHMAARLAVLEVPVVLVLDDFGPERGPALADGVISLLKHAGSGLRIIVMSRSDPVLPLRRYSVSGRLTEIRAGSLALNEREIAAILEQHGVRIGASALRALHQRTEGWAAGVRLAAMSMGRHPDPERFVEQFSGDDHSVVGYLVEEVLDAQPAEVRRLLLATSVVDDVNAELAAELAGAEAGPVFAELVRQNAFVVALGHGWYRYHPMFREALRLVLRHEAPAEVDALNRRAAEWFERAGRLGEAVHQAVRAGDWRYAAWMVVDRLAIGRVLGFRPGDPLTGLFREMPAASAYSASEPEPAIVAAAAAAAVGDEQGCSMALQHVDRVFARDPGRRTQAALLCAAAVRFGRNRPLGHLAVAGLPGSSLRFPDRLLKDGPELRALLTSVRAAALFRDGGLREAARLFEAAVVAATEAGGDFQRRSCLAYLSLIEALLGRFTRATELDTKAAQLPEVSLHPAGRRTAVAHLASAAVHLEHYELAAADEELDKTGAALLECPDELLSALHRFVCARVEIGWGRPERALELLGVPGGSARRVPWLDRRVRLVAAEAHAALGAADAALAAAEQAGGVGTPGSAVALARAWLCRGEPRAAAEIVRHGFVESATTPADVRVEAWLLDARLSYQRGDGSRGRRSLDRALRLAEREQIRLPFALSREWLTPVLRHDPELARPYHRILDPLLLATAAPSAAAPGGAEEATVETLSPRETDVLKRVARMMTTEEIAAELCLSINTVKTHLKSIYRKLGVTRRGEAVRRARSLALLAD
ncbi:LuxR C-terminal-related transcriptional regulator [Actinomadura sp. 9N407]|uniref:LuxR C-terminal-related transcriptional regulator n=1 Tax=Actinomadura sp. 9N407 TaxID=3375154 RepID=UPI003799F7B3